MKTKLPRVISLKHAKKPRNGVTLYANVQSRSRGTRVIHTVIRKNRRMLCSCESFGFGPGKTCIHIQAVRRRLKISRGQAKTHSPAR